MKKIIKDKTKQYVRTHMIFDIEMDSKFTRRARLVAGGHNTSPPLSTTYYTVVTREIVRPEFIIDSLNGLNICAWDIDNACLNSPCRGKCGPKQDQNLGVRKDTFS